MKKLLAVLLAVLLLGGVFGVGASAATYDDYLAVFWENDQMQTQVSEPWRGPDTGDRFELFAFIRSGEIAVADSDKDAGDCLFLAPAGLEAYGAYIDWYESADRFIPGGAIYPHSDSATCDAFIRCYTEDTQEQQKVIDVYQTTSVLLAADEVARHNAKIEALTAYALGLYAFPVIIVENEEVVDVDSFDDDDWAHYTALVEAFAYAVDMSRFITSEVREWLEAHPDGVRGEYFLFEGLPTNFWGCERICKDFAVACAIRDGKITLGILTARFDEMYAALLNSATPATYTVTYDLKGGAGSFAQQSFTETTAGAGAAVTLHSAEPTKTGYTFKGWDTSAAAATAVYAKGASFTTAQSLTLCAVWEAVVVPPVYYTLTYNANGGAGGPAPQTGIAAGTPITLATTGLPTRDGHTFKGWAAASGGTALITSVTVNANTTVYAVWEKDAEPEPEDPIFDFFASFLPRGVATVFAWIVRYLLFGWLWARWL